MSSSGGRVEDLIQESLMAGDRPSDYRERRENHLPEDYDPTPREATLDRRYSEFLNQVEAGRTVDTNRIFLEKNLEVDEEILERLKRIEDNMGEGREVGRRSFMREGIGLAALVTAGVTVAGYHGLDEGKKDDISIETVSEAPDNEYDLDIMDDGDVMDFTDYVSGQPETSGSFPDLALYEDLGAGFDDSDRSVDIIGGERVVSRVEMGETAYSEARSEAIELLRD